MVIAVKKNPKFTKFGKPSKKKMIGANEETIQNSDEEQEEVPREVLVIAQEVRMVKLLASNDINKRNRQMKKLKKWLQLRASSSFSFSEEDFMRLWKGLYYHMWFSDKPLVQEELAAEMGKLLDAFDGNIELSVNFFGAFMKTMCQQWFGMDQWRMDKFMMLVRRMLRATFHVLKANGWSQEAIQNFNEHMSETILGTDTIALGLAMHYLDIFFEELAKVADGDINAEQVGEFIKPFVRFMSEQSDYKLIEHCRKKVFYHLLYQSTLGREYEEKYTAWRRMGFPTKSIHDLEKIDNDELEEESENEMEVDEQPAVAAKHLDPRAGNVDVYIAELPLEAQYILDEIEKYLQNSELNTKRRKMFRNLMQTFETYQSGVFPLGVKTMPRFEGKSEKPLIKDKIEQLENLENEVYGTERKLKQLNKRKRRKLLKSLNFQEADESNFSQIIEKALPKQYLKEKRKQAQQAMMNGWVEEELDQEDVVAAKKPKLVEEANKPTKKAKQNGIAHGDNQVKKAKKPLKQQNVTESNEKSKELTAKDFKESPKTKSEPKLKAEKPAENKAAKENKQQDTTNTNEAKQTTAETPKKELKQPKVLKIGSPTETATVSKPKKPFESEWDEPLAEGEMEYFIPSNKLRLKEANKSVSHMITPVRAPPSKEQSSSAAASTPKTPGSSSKRVKIALKMNTSQNPSEYLRQIKNSPNVPYDATKKPGKGLLKPNSMPSPINPFYKKKLGLSLLNDTV